MKLCIMRGIPGSGKTTIARKTANRLQLCGHEVVICSADQFFENFSTNGGSTSYKFDASKLHEAHRACFRNAYNGFMAKKSVMVDNTNTMAHEIAPYVALGEMFNYDIKILTLLSEVNAAFERQIHGVPLTTLQRLERQLNVPLPRQFALYEERVFI